MRRNLNINYLVFNNQIYGLTKGQYSPTSEKGKVTKATPYGSIEEPFNPSELALGAKSSFVARSLDRDPKHLQATLKRAHEHTGTSFVEIYQNCTVFNDGAFFPFSEKETKKTDGIFVEHGKPLVFGNQEEYGIKLDNMKPVIVNLSETGTSVNDLWIHDEKDKTKAHLLASFFDTNYDGVHYPRPFGVFYTEDRATYDAGMNAQIEEVTKRKGKMPLSRILSGDKTWHIA